MTEPSASKGRRLMMRMVVDKRREQAGAVEGPVRFVRCSARRRKERPAGQPATGTLVGCRERLAAIVYTATGIEFEVLAPGHDEGGVWVLERPAAMAGADKRRDEGVVVRPPGARQAFRCARCGGITTADMKALANLQAQR